MIIIYHVISVPCRCSDKSFNSQVLTEDIILFSHIILSGCFFVMLFNLLKVTFRAIQLPETVFYSS